MKFKFPETLDGLDKAALAKIIADARTALREISDNEDATEADLEVGLKIADLVDEAKGKVAELDVAEAKKAEDLDRMRKAAAEDEDPEGEDNEEDEGDEEDEDLAAEIVEEEVKEPALVAASPLRGRAAKKAAAARPAKAAIARSVTITAAQEARGYAAGTEMKNGISELGSAIADKAKTLSQGRLGGPQGLRQRYDVARIDLSGARQDNLTEDALNAGEFTNVYDLFSKASSDKRLDGGSLVASGGWCAPPETLMGLFNDATTEGLFELPSIQAKRGSIQFTKGVDFQTVFASANGDFSLTEAQVIASTVKPCIEVTCPTFETVVLDATGVCISSGLLTKAAFPEQVADFTEKVMVAHQHKKAKRQYDKVIAGSTALTSTGAVSALDSLGKLELLATYLREKEKWSDSTVVEVTIPAWYKVVLRADLAGRSGTGTSALNVSDAEINSWFKTRKIAPQWLRSIGQDIVNTAGAIAVPPTVTIGLYRAGTWVELTNDIIDLGTLYDSTNLKTNTYTAMFTEEGVGLAQMRFTSYKTTLPTLANGVTGAQTDTLALIAQTA